jgi:hypothetical protein
MFRQDVEGCKAVPVNYRKQLHLSDFVDGTIKRGDKITYVYGRAGIKSEETFEDIRIYVTARDVHYMVVTDKDAHFGADCSIHPRSNGVWGVNYWSREIKRPTTVTKTQDVVITV